MLDGDRDAYLAAFSPDAVMIDDGNPQSHVEWADQWLFGQSRAGSTPSTAKPTED